VTRRISYAIALAALSAISAPVLAQQAQPPLQQVDFPELAIGETAVVRIKVPASTASSGAIQIYAVDLVDHPDRGLQVLDIDCGEPGFIGTHWEDDSYVSCMQVKGAPHQAFTMLVAVRNQSAPAGKVTVPDALVSLEGQRTTKTALLLQSLGD